MTSKVIYKGNLRTESEHLQSGSKMITDAPVDNHGKGEAFSPTDTVANAVATCMLTVMGIKAENLGIDLEGTTAEVTKTMASDPRRISKVEIKVHFPSDYGEKNNKILENSARVCPVIQSLNPDIELDLTFQFS